MLRCRKKTLSRNVQLHEQNRPKGGEGKQYILKGMCTVCNSKQSQFVSASVGHGVVMGRGVVNNLLNSKLLPKLHIPGHKFTGPGTQVKGRLLKGDVPVNELDKAAQFHDMAYSIFKDTKDRHVFDKKLQDEAFNLVKNLSTSLKDQAEAGLVGGVMLAKQKLGLGVRQKR
jgi:hypothetical protein